MFYLIQHMWFLLLIAAVLGAFLMWLIRVWSKEEKLSELVNGWETRLSTLKTENGQLKAQFQAASVKLSSIATLEAEVQRRQQECAALSTQRQEAEQTWAKKLADAEQSANTRSAALDVELAKLRSECAGLTSERDALARQCDDHANQLSGLNVELQESKKDLVSWRERFSARDTEANESLIHLTAVTTEFERLREATQANALVQQEVEVLRQKLASAEAELGNLRSEIVQTQNEQNHWRQRWQESEDHYSHAQTEIADLRARLQILAQTEIEKNRFQAETDSLTERIVHLESQIKDGDARMAALASENQRLLEQASASAAPGESNAELRARAATAEEEAVKLRSHLATASYLQDEWRAKWHDIDNRHSAAQLQINELTARVGALTGLEIENNKLQEDVANWSSKYTLLQAEADLQFNKVKELSERLAALASDQPHDDRDNGWQLK
jgi:chromosome segregation ATPase